jgi:tetratricopeptide (TPR) repeat protein
MREPNTLLDALIEEAGMSRAGLADRINKAAVATGTGPTHYDHTAVSRWLAGQRPRRQVPTLLCEVLGRAVGRPLTLDDIGMGHAHAAPGVELAQFINRAPALWRGDQQNQTALLDTAVVTGLSAIAPVWEWENPPEDTDVSRRGSARIGQGEIALIQSARGRYEQMYRQVGGVATRARVVHFLDQYAAPVLRGSYGDRLGRQVHRSVGALVAIAGICAYDADYQGLAQRYFQQALRLAKASADRAFGGYVIALLTNQALFLRDYRQAVAFAEAALRTAGADLTPALSADLHAMQAKAFGRMHQRTDALAAMHRAERAADRIGAREEPAETGYVQPGLVDTQLAETLLSLGDLPTAHTYAQQAADAATHPRGQVNRLVTVTRVAVAEGNLDHAAETAHTMLDLARGMESVRLNRRFSAIADSLRGQKARSVREAVERIEHTVALPL